MSDNNALEVKYVLYSHYSVNESDDFIKFKNGTRPENLKSVAHLLEHFRGLKELLTA